MAGNSKEASQHAKEAGIFSASNVRAVYRLRGSLARCVHARHLRKRHHGADAGSIARHRASDRLHRSADEVCTPSRDYQTRYAVRESRVARTGTPGVASNPLSRNRRTGRRRRPHTSLMCGLRLLLVSDGRARASARTSTPDFFEAAAQK